jgi:cytochrome c oxidase subunit II
VKKIRFAVVSSLASFAVSPATADQPTPWAFGFQDSATDMMAEISWFNQYTLYFMIPIVLFVLFLLIYSCWRFSEKRNPIPSKTTHNTFIEVIWTVIPIFILIAIAVPSFKLLNKQLMPQEDAAMTIKATGNQWYWSYEYQSEQPLSFDSLLLKDQDRAKAGKEDKAVYPTLLAVDNEMVVPVNTVVRITSTAADVIHAFAMPAFGIKIDAIPGRLNETWFKANKEGLYYGQCSEICGKDHAYMPIAIRVVDKAKYGAWFLKAKTDLNGANKDLMAAVAAAKVNSIAAR